MSLWQKFLKWNRRRRFIAAYKILRNESERHRDAGHSVDFKAVDESYIMLTCSCRFDKSER